MITVFYVEMNVMNVESIVNYLMPSYHNAFVRHPESLDEAQAIVNRHLETSCLVIRKNKDTYVFDELLCADKTCIDRSQNVFSSIKAIIKKHRITVSGERYIFHFKGDACHEEPDFPLLSNSRNVGNGNIILWPLLIRRNYLLTPYRYSPFLHDEITRFRNSPDKIVWDEKIPVFLFRGMNSGNPFPSVKYPWNQSRVSRCALLVESLKLPSELRTMVDVGFNELYPRGKLLRKKFRDKEFLASSCGKYLQQGSTIEDLQNDVELALANLKPSLSRTRLYRYKYLLCPEGFDCASALSWVLASNSLAIVPPFHYENVIINSQALRPYVHFLPIREDYSDLADVMRWALAHDQECRQMVQDANKYMQPFVNGNCMERVQRQIIEKLLA